MSLFSFGSRARIAASALVSAAALTGAASAQQEEFVLDGSDRWISIQPIEPGTPEFQLLEAQRALDRGDPGRAILLAKRFLEANPLSPLRAQALLIRGDATLALGDEYQALFDYEELIRRYPGSEAFVTALEREFDIAVKYANGMRRRFFGTVRIVPADEDAEELLIRIQERLPGSELAERAGLELADFYFRTRDLRMAAEAYDLFIRNYPRSQWQTKARLRLIYSFLAEYRGPQYDGTGLFEARARLRDLQVADPGLAEQVGAEAILVRVYESEAQKLLATAEWYWKVKDAISTELFIRRLVRQYPDSVATLDALRVVPMVLEKLPRTIRDGAPDYAALRLAKLGVPWDTMPPPATRPDTPESESAGEERIR
jgi:outer membrane protein assembly factor BamD (BamD/ComL family)